MTYRTFARAFAVFAALISISACSSGGAGTPAIEFQLPGGSNSIVTTDSRITISGTAISEHPIDSVTWALDAGNTGVASGTDNWQIANLPLLVGDNRLTVTASDTAGNVNSKSLLLVREQAPAAGTGGQGGGQAGDSVPEPILMFSYQPDLKNSAPVEGAKITAGPVYFHVVPSDDWQADGINHMAYYCCTKPGDTNASPEKLAVSRAPWSMYIDLSPYQAGETREIQVEANLQDGSTLKAPESSFTLNSPGAATNRAPTLRGTPPATVTVGNAYSFKPTASDPDNDTLSFGMANQPGWLHIDKLTGQVSGTPAASDVGIHGNIIVSASDGTTSASLAPFSIEVQPGSGSSTPTPPPATPPPSNSAAPVISSFKASPTAISKGESVTLSWSVSGADSVSISPAPGSVSGNSVVVSPGTSTTYKLTAKNASGSTQSSVTVTVASAAGSSDWNVTKKPPSLSSPRLIDISKTAPITAPASGITCSGKIYKVTLKDNEDGYVYMSGSSPLQYPLHVTGGRNVRVVGLQFRMVTQPGCGVGELPNRPENLHPNANIHPRLPGSISLRMEQSGHTFLEGLHIDVNGHEADCIVSRNPDSMTDATAQSQRDFTVQNTYCAGVEGLGDSAIGDGVHGDLWHNQGRDVLRHLVFENVTMRTSQEGIIIQGSGTATKSLLLRRYDYSWDPRFVGDDNYEMFGLAAAGTPGPNFTFDDVRIDDYRNLNYVKLNGQRYGNASSSTVQPHPEIRSGKPPEGAFALPGRTGINYVSPHGTPPGT